MGCCDGSDGFQLGAFMMMEGFCLYTKIDLMASRTDSSLQNLR